MTAATVEAPDVDQAFRDALQADAGAAAAAGEAQHPAPPRHAVSADPDAPHGRAEDGTPLAPHGIGRNGRPRIKPAGPGRGGKKPKDDAPRVTNAPPASADSSPSGSPGAGGPDYREDLTGLGMSVWLAGSALRGGKLWILPVPDARPYAALWRQAMPGMVEAWNLAAQKNPAVRGYVEKLSGDGSWAWVMGVAVTTSSFVTGCMELAKKDTPETSGARAAARASATEANDAMLEEFMTAQLKAMGVAGPGESEAA